LFVVTPHDYAQDPIAAMLPLEEIPTRRAGRRSLRKGSWRLAETHEVTRNVPIELFRPVDYLNYKPTSGHTLLATDGRAPLLQAARVAKGRVLAAGYNGQNRIREFGYIRAFGHLIPAAIFRKGEYAGPRTALLTYYRQLLVRCVLWAAGRRAPDELTFDGGLKRGLRLSVVCPMDAPKNAELWVRFATPLDLWVKELNVPLTLTLGSNSIDQALPFRLPSGKVKVDVILRSETGVQAFGARVFELASGGAIASLALGRPGYGPGETGRVTVTLDREPERTVRCRLTVQDRHGRVGFATEASLERRQSEMAFETACLLPPWFRAKAELLREDGSTLSVASVDGTLGRRKGELFGRYSFFTWGANDDQLPSAAGVASRAARGPGALALAAKGANSMPYLWPDFRARGKALGGGRKARVPCLHDPAFLQRTRAELGAQARYWRDYQPAAYMLADEVRFSPATYIYFEGCWDRHSLRAFRSWLRAGYGTIEQLNAQWGTEFTTWDSVLPMAAAEIAHSNATNFAAWADFRRFGEVTFAAYLDYCRKVVRGAAPGGLTFLSGTVNPGASNGHDWWRLLKSVDVVGPYRHGVQRELARSFAPYTGCISLPYAAGYGWTGADLHYLMFKAMLDQSAGVHSWTSSLFYHPEGALSRSGKDTAEVDRIFRDGLWDYVRAFKRHTPVAVLYSMPSLRAAYARNELKAFEHAIEGWVALLHDLCIGWRFVAPEQIQAGILSDDSFEALVLPMCRSLSDTERTAISTFIANGGSVITEDYAGQMDEHCTPRDSGLVASLEPKTKGSVVVHTLDTGQYRAIAEHYREAQVGPWQAKARELLSRAGVRPFIEATVDRKSFHGYTALYSLGETQLVIALPSPRMPVGDRATVAMLSSREAHLHLPLARRFLGRSHTAAVSVRKGWPGIVAFVPTEVQAPEITVVPSRVRAGNPVEVRVIPRGQSHVPNAVALCLFDPQGRALTRYSRALVLTERGRQIETIPLALNETPGRYAVRTVDLLTGTKQEASFRVEARGFREKRR